MDTLLGPIVTVDEVCQAGETLMSTWLPQVLPDLQLEAPKQYQQVPTRDAIINAAAGDFPAVGVFSSGTDGAPVRDENGDYSKTFDLTVVVYLRGDSYRTTQAALRKYVAVVQALFAQNPSLGGIASGLALGEESYDLVDANAARTLAGGAIDMAVTVPVAFSDSYSPPYDPLSVVQTVSTDVEPDLPFVPS